MIDMHYIFCVQLKLKRVYLPIFLCRVEVFSSSVSVDCNFLPFLLHMLQGATEMHRLEFPDSVSVKRSNKSSYTCKDSGVPNPSSFPFDSSCLPKPNLTAEVLVTWLD